jgi:transcriptional regulator with XRE-family HTH domain
MAGRSTFDRKLEAQVEAVRRQCRMAVKAARVDAGVPQSTVAAASGLSPSHYCEVESGAAEPSIETLVRIAVALGRRPSFAFLPESDPLVRDRRQAPMVEAFLSALHPRWSAMAEVAVYRPVHGVIDVVALETSGPEVVAIEFQGGIGRLEETLRWSGQKADALLATGPIIGADGPRQVSRVLALASTDANRQIVRSFERTLHAVYPAPSVEIVRAFTTADAPWPGSGIIWFAFDGRDARLLRNEPRSLWSPVLGPARMIRPARPTPRAGST